MANVTSIQVLENGGRNYVVKLTGILDTADIGVTDLIDTTAAAFLPSNLGNEVVPTTVAIKEVMFDIEDSLAVNLFWDATADQLALSLVGRGKLKFDPPMNNNAGAGKTGKLQYSTVGWAASAVLSFSLVLKCIKTVS